MVKIEINGKEYNVPSDWDDVTMKDYCDWFYKLPSTDGIEDGILKATAALKNESIIISRILGEDDSFAMGLPLQAYTMVRNHTSFIYSIDGFLETNVFHITIDGRKYWIPKPEEMSLRQYIDSDIIMKDSENKQQFIELLACLLVPVDKGEYDGNYEELVPKIERMSARDGLPFVYTFLKKKIISKLLTRDCLRVAQVVEGFAKSTQGS